MRDGYEIGRTHKSVVLDWAQLPLRVATAEWCALSDAKTESPCSLCLIGELRDGRSLLQWTGGFNSLYSPSSIHHELTIDAPRAGSLSATREKDRGRQTTQWAFCRCEQSCRGFLGKVWNETRGCSFFQNWLLRTQPPRGLGSTQRTQIQQTPLWT